MLDEYAFAGILDERREAELRREAETAYREALILNPSVEDIRLDLGRLLIRQDRVAEALEELSPLAGAPSPDAAAWLMEALFRLGRYDDLRRLSTRLDANAMPDRLKNALMLWQPDETAVKQEVAA